MQPINDDIKTFIQQQKAASICVVNTEGDPYCFSCFYTFNAADGLLYFKTAATSYHTQQMVQKPILAGTILPDKLNAMVVKGIQWEGELLPLHLENAQSATFHYYKRFPLALAIPGEVYSIQINCIKMTDSSKGFGKKILWERYIMELRS